MTGNSPSPITFLVAAAAVAAVVMLVACEPPVFDGRTNREACIEMVTTVNHVYRSCDEDEPMDVDHWCPARLDLYEEDCTEYFDCLRDAYWCDSPGDVDNTKDECVKCY